MSVPTEPIFAGEKFVHMKFYFAPRNPGDPTTIIGTITLMPGEDNIVLDAIIGPKGDPGPPAPFWRPEWTSTITAVSDLTAMSLGVGDAGRAWYIAGYWHIWTGTTWVVYLGAIPGPPGPMPNLHISAHGVAVPTGGPYGPLNVAVSGTSLDPYLDFGIPLIPGPVGPSTAILAAPDFDNSVPIQDGQVPVFNGTTNKFRGGDPAGNAADILTVPESSFGPGGTFSGTWQTVATLIVPGKTRAYYPIIDGHLLWKRSGLFNNAQVEVQVRSMNQGSTAAPETGDLCARALYDPSTLDTTTVAHIREHFSDTGNPSRALAPASAVGRVSAGQAKVYYVLLYKSGGSGSYVYDTAGSHLSLKMFPVD